MTSSDAGLVPRRAFAGFALPRKLFTSSRIRDRALWHRMDRESFEEICRYVDFDESHGRLLRALLPHAEPHFARIVDDFYEAIQNSPGANAVLANPEQVERLKRTLLAWHAKLLAGPHDHEYAKERAKIGRVHVRVNLPQIYMFTAMNRIRSRLLEVVHTALATDMERCVSTALAVNKVLDIELAIMLHTYREDLVAKMRTSERLATIGQLTASIGHELRNPLGIVESSLYLMGQRMERESIDDPVLAKHHGRIAKQVQVCGQTITDLLELARSNPPNVSRFELHDFVAEVLSEIETPEMTLENEVPPGLIIHADAGQLRQVLNNLLSNAAAATGKHGRVSVCGARSGDTTEVTVADDGPGIAPEDRERVFEALFTTKPRGTGLGLALCRRIAEAHGGSIRVGDSEVGAHLVVTLPDRASPRS